MNQDTKTKVKHTLMVSYITIIHVIFIGLLILQYYEFTGWQFTPTPPKYVLTQHDYIVEGQCKDLNKEDCIALLNATKQYSPKGK